jgi:ASC-1-like (ASCH) protein
MNLIIKNIILYPVNRGLEPRIIKFSGNKIDVITGFSKRGKSSIIEIIDYCLGNSDCSIPIGEIRNLVDVFALKIIVNGKDVFIGRESPGNSGQSSKKMYFQEIDEKGEYKQFNSNEWLHDKEKYSHNSESIKSILNSYGKFLDVEESVNEKEESITVGFRDTTAFQFQSQSIIANGNTIFFNTDDFFHQNRLKKLFPLVLGYKSYDMLLLEDEIKALEKDWSKISSKVEDLKERYQNWQSNIYEYYSEAIKLGLSNSDIDITTSSVNLIRFELEKILLDVKQNNLFKEGNTIRFSEKLEELELERTALFRNLQTKKMELNKILKFENTKKEYIENVYSQINERLKPIDWFLNRKGIDYCPFCESKSENALIELQKLKVVKEENHKLKDIEFSTDLSFEKEKNILKQTIKELEASINQFDKNINILLNETKEGQFVYQRIYEFVGKVSTFIKNLPDENNELVSQLNSIDKNLSGKRKELNELKQKFDKQHILNKVSKSIKTYIDLLPIEHKNQCNVLIDPEKYLGIKIKDDKNKTETFLNKIGSGSNYMCYHLATMLGLHEYFYKLKEVGKTNYVPSFLVLDQPSQVYYPDILEEKLTNNKQLKIKESEDLDNTKKIFDVCAKFIERTNNEIQIIILEHAPPSTWKEVDSKFINLVEEWRGKEEDGYYSDDYNALLQKEWLIN